MNKPNTLPDMKDCEHGYKGSCCCNCKYQLNLMCHPWNGGGKFDKLNIGRGRISEQMGWACVGPEISEGVRAIFSDKEHGMCEMHERRKLNEKA